MSLLCGRGQEQPEGRERKRERMNGERAAWKHIQSCDYIQENPSAAAGRRVGGLTGGVWKLACSLALMINVSLLFRNVERTKMNKKIK